MPSISGAVRARPSVFETQYTARGVRQATSRRRPPSLYSSVLAAADAAGLVGGREDRRFLQVVPWTP